MATPKISVMFVLSTLTGGGAERTFLNILGHLDRTVFKPILVLYRSSGPYLSLLRDDVTVVELGVSRPLHTSQYRFSTSVCGGYIRLHWKRLAGVAITRLLICYIRTKDFLRRNLIYRDNVATPLHCCSALYRIEMRKELLLRMLFAMYFQGSSETIAVLWQLPETRA